MTPLKPPSRPRHKSIAPESVRPYDLTAPKPLEIAPLKGLEAAYERFARSATHALTKHFGRPCGVAVISTDAVRFADFAAAVAWPAGVAVLALDDTTRGSSRKALVVFDRALVLKLVETLFGASDARPDKPSPTRSLTRIELSVVNDVVTTLLPDLNAGLGALAPLAAKLERMESNVELIADLSGPEALVASTFRIQVDQTVGAFTLALPHASLKPHEAPLSRV